MILASVPLVNSIAGIFQTVLLLLALPFAGWLCKIMIRVLVEIKFLNLQVMGSENQASLRDEISGLKADMAVVKERGVYLAPARRGGTR